MRSLYEKDFLAWTDLTANLTRTRQFERVDWDNVIEEIEALGRSERDKLVSSLKVLFAHLLKWQFQPEKHSKSWENTIFKERSSIVEYLEDMPGLQQFLSSERIVKAYNRGRSIAIKETELNEELFPRDYPYNIEQILDFEFLP